MRFIAAGAVCAFLLFLPALGADKRADSASSRRPLKLGYVDLTRVLKGYERRTDMEEDLKHLRTAKTEAARAKLSEIAQYTREIEQLALGTPDRLRLEEKRKAARRGLEQFRQESLREINARMAEMLDSFYEDLLGEVEALAKEDDYDFVLKHQSREKKGRFREEVLFQISQGVVLYAKPKYDLSGTVLRRMNKEYAAKKKAGPAKAKDAAKAKDKK